MSVFPHQLFKFTVDGLVAFRTHAIDKNSRRFIFRLIMNLVQKSIPELLFLIAGANVASSTSEHSIQQRCEKFPVLISEIQFFQIIVAIPSIVHLIYTFIISDRFRRSASESCLVSIRSLASVFLDAISGISSA